MNWIRAVRSSDNSNVLLDRLLVSLNRGAGHLLRDLIPSNWTRQLILKIFYPLGCDCAPHMFDLCTYLSSLFSIETLEFRNCS
jgi:hypothetical protein